MCDLFAISSSKEEKAVETLLRFGDFSKNNPHGWGIAFYQGKNLFIRKNPEKAKTTDKFSRAANLAKGKIIMAHLRQATKGSVREINCQPFKQHFHGKSWIFAHNGDVPKIEVHPRTLGETDSESVFNFLLDGIDEYQSQGDARGIFSGLTHGIKKLFKIYGRRITLNLLISDGNLLYVFNHSFSKQMYFLKREAKGNSASAVLVSTRKLTDEKWKIIPEDRLLVLEKGEILFLSSKIE